MKLTLQIKYLGLLMAIACLPATAQLLYYGFTPPLEIPYGIAAEDAMKLQEPIVWIDARPDDLFQIAHIPGALNLNRTNWDKILPQLFDSYKPGNAIIVYCSPDCWESEEIASRIRGLGFNKTLVLKGGFEAWKK